MLRFVHISFSLKVAAIAIVSITALISIIQLITSAILMRRRLDTVNQPSIPVDQFYGARLSTDIPAHGDSKVPYAHFLDYDLEESNATHNILAGPYASS